MYQIHYNVERPRVNNENVTLVYHTTYIPAVLWIGASLYTYRILLKTLYYKIKETPFSVHLPRVIAGSYTLI